MARFIEGAPQVGTMADKGPDPRTCAICGRKSPKATESCISCKRRACNQCLQFLFGDGKAGEDRIPGLYCTECQERLIDAEVAHGRPNYAA